MGLGPLLRSGRLGDLVPLGAVGNPVYAAAEPLLAAVRRQLGKDVAGVFAIPRPSERGDVIDWYAPVSGSVVPWSAASPEERITAKAALLATRGRILSHSESLQAEQDGERQVFGRLLEQAICVPSDEYVYLVDGRAVVAFWGFAKRGAPPGLDVLGELDVGAQGEVVPGPSPPGSLVPLPGSESVLDGELAESANGLAARPARPWYWWLFWLPLLLALLGLLWFGLRSCGPGLTVGLPQIALPWRTATEPLDSLPSPASGLQSKTVPAPSPTGVANGLDGAPSPTPSQESAEPVAPSAAPPAAPLPEAEPAREEAQPPSEPEPPAATPEEEPARPDAAASDDPALPPPFPAPPADPAAPEAPSPGAGKKNAPLMIPPQAVSDGSTSFLNGRWKSVTGLQDSDGNPVQLEYEFKDGKGTATLNRRSGASEHRCVGTVRPAMRDGKLVIDEPGSITCPDGTQFRRSTVECEPDERGRARCRGINEDGTAYKVTISGK